MCQPDDFPPYDRLHDSTLPTCEHEDWDRTIAEWVRCPSPASVTVTDGRRELRVCAEDASLYQPVMPDILFRKLDPAEESSFRQWAREHHAPGEDVNPLWHPVIRDECRVIDATTHE